MKKIIGTILATSMLFGTVPGVCAVSTIAPNEVVYGYQSIDFEKDYSVGEIVMSNPLSGGQVSKDGQLYCSVEDGGTKDSVSVTIDGSDSNKYLKITDNEANGSSAYASFKMQDKNNALNNDMDYFVIKCRMKSGDNTDNAVKNLNIFRGLNFNEDGYIYRTGLYDTRYMPKKYDWNDYMFVADTKAGKLYTAVNGTIIESLTHSDSAYSSVDDFLGLQFYTQGAKNTKPGILYMDNIELYGVKKSTHEVTCSIEKDADNPSVIYASFTQPVKMSAANVSVPSTVEYENGRYKITVKNISAAGTVVAITGVTDIYGTVCKDVYTSVTAQEEKFLQTIDFEKYNAGDSILDNTNASSDGIWFNATVNTTTHKVVSDGDNKVLEVRVAPGEKGGTLNAYNKKVSSADTAEYLVIKYRMKNGNTDSDMFPFIGLLDYALRRDETYVYPFASSTGTKLKLGQNVWNEYMFILNRSTGEVSLAVDGRPTDMKITNRGSNPASFFKEQWALGYSGSSNEQKLYLDDIKMYGINKNEAALTGILNEDGGKVSVSFNHPVSLDDSNIEIDNGAAVSGIEYKDGKYIISFKDISANSLYNVKVKNVTDVFGCTLSELSGSFTTGKMSMNKNYLTVSKFTGSDDFESYDGLGIVKSSVNPTVTIKNTKTGYSIDDAWTMSSEWGAEYALVKDGDNTVLKISVPGVAADGNQTSIIQPDCEEGDYTKAVKGNIYVYSFRFKSGGENEAAFGETAIEDFVNPINLSDGTVSMCGGTAKHAFDTGRWVDFKYVIDWTGENQIHYAIADGKIVGSIEKNLSAIKSSTPRIAQIKAIEGAENSAFYIDDIEVYTTNGIKGNLSVLDSSAEIKTGEGLTVEFDGPVASITADNIENAPAEIDSITSLGGNKCVINFKKALDEGSYTIKLKNVEDVYKNTLIEKELSFRVISGGKLDGISDLMIITKKNKDTVVTVTTKNTGAAVGNADILVAAYDESGKLTGALTQNDITIGMGTRDYTMSGKLDGKAYKAFIWDENMKPLCNTFKK